MNLLEQLNEILDLEDLSQLLSEQKAILLRGKDIKLDDLIDKGLKINKEELSMVFTTNLSVEDYEKLGIKINDILGLLIVDEPPPTYFKITLRKIFPEKTRQKYSAELLKLIIKEDLNVDLDLIIQNLSFIIQNYNNLPEVIELVIEIDKKYDIYKPKPEIFRKLLYFSFMLQLDETLPNYLIDNYHDAAGDIVLTAAVEALDVNMVKKLLENGYKLKKILYLSEGTKSFYQILDMLCESLDPDDIFNYFIPVLKNLDSKCVTYFIKKMKNFKEIDVILDMIIES